MTSPANIFGLKVIKAAEVPKMTLAKDVMVSPEFRKEIDAWMREFFGTTCLVERGKAFVMEQMGTVIVHPDDYPHLMQVKGKVAAMTLGEQG